MVNNTNINDEVDVNMTLSERELKAGPVSFIFSSSLSLIDDSGEVRELNTKETDNSAIFSQNYKYWNIEVGLMSTNNLDNSYFKSIVNMGLDAVPFILKELEKSPSPLVHALDQIFPGVMKYEGFVSLKEACDRWMAILKQY